jgi:hypothetical protein
MQSGTDKTKQQIFIKAFCQIEGYCAWQTPSRLGAPSGAAKSTDRRYRKHGKSKTKATAARSFSLKIQLRTCVSKTGGQLISHTSASTSRVRIYYHWK